jgi:hypothetical protein
VGLRSGLLGHAADAIGRLDNLRTPVDVGGEAWYVPTEPDDELLITA